MGGEWLAVHQFERLLEPFAGRLVLAEPFDSGEHRNLGWVYSDLDKVDEDGAILVAFTQTDLRSAHVVARRIGDAAWPRPVWGAVPAKPYGAGELARFIAALRHTLGFA